MTSGPGEALAATSDPARLVPADLAGVRAQAAAWEAHADAVADVAVEVARVDIGGWSGAGKSAFVDACRRHVTRLRQTATAYREAASALTAHAHEIEAARRAAERAVSEWQRGEAATQASRREQEQARAVLGAGLLSAGPSSPTSGRGGLVWADPGEPIRRNAAAMLADAWEAAQSGEESAARRLRALAEQAFTGSIFSGRVVPQSVAAVLAQGTHGTLLRDLQRMAPAELAGYAKTHPGLLSRMLALGPERILAWWNTLDPAARTRLAAGLPRVIGNLDGIPPSIRDQVNSAQLVTDLAAAEKAVADAREAVKANASNRYAIVLAQQRLTDALRHYDELKAISKAYGAGPTGGTPHQLYAYQPGAHTRVALSTGLLDDAAHISVLVPGMSTTAGGIGSYANAARDLRNQQSELSNIDPSRVAVLSWLDYDPPGGTDVWGVTHDDLAEAGGDRLSNTLRGLQTVKTWGAQSPNLSVVAHSYGTNVAAFALSRSDTSAGNLVLLGSAGITPTAPVAPVLNVPSGQVFASQGTHDGWAPIGQGLSGRTDPTDPGFGAHTFTSEATTIDGHELEGITQHGPFGSDGGVSYLDNLSSAQYGTAKATMGEGDSLPHAGTPSDRLGTRLNGK